MGNNVVSENIDNSDLTPQSEEELLKEIATIEAKISQLKEEANISPKERALEKYKTAYKVFAEAKNIRGIASEDRLGTVKLFLEGKDSELDLRSLETDLDAFQKDIDMLEELTSLFVDENGKLHELQGDEDYSKYFPDGTPPEIVPISKEPLSIDEIEAMKVKAELVVSEYSTIVPLFDAAAAKYDGYVVQLEEQLHNLENLPKKEAEVQKTLVADEEVLAKQKALIDEKLAEAEKQKERQNKIDAFQRTIAEKKAALEKIKAEKAKQEAEVQEVESSGILNADIE